MASFGVSLVEENVGVIPPPPGVTPNFISPPSLQHVVLIANIILPIVSALFVALRLSSGLLRMWMDAAYLSTMGIGFRGDGRRDTSRHRQAFESG